MSSSNPNLQNLPSGSTFAKMIKACFEPVKGWIFGGSDFERGWSGQQTTDGGYIITGYTYSLDPGFYCDVWCCVPCGHPADVHIKFKR